jgi:hypothetical protein
VLVTNPQNGRQVHQDAAKWIADVKKVRGLHEDKVDEFYQAFIVKKGQPTSEDVKKLDAELDRWETLVRQIHHDLEAWRRRSRATAGGVTLQRG